MLLLINFGLAIFLYIFLSFDGTPDFLIGFGVGALALTFYERAYGWRIWWLVSLVAFMVWEIVVSNAKLTWLILQPKPRFRPGIVAVPLTVTTDLEVIALATMVTLTPGTLSIDFQKNTRGKRILYIHSFIIKDAEALRQHIKHVFERRLALVTRGVWR